MRYVCPDLGDIVDQFEVSLPTELLQPIGAIDLVEAILTVEIVVTEKVFRYALTAQRTTTLLVNGAIHWNN